jgi:eukaryotic-like serine/threonine-protein kinase
VTELIKIASEQDAHLAEVLEEYLEAAESGAAPDRAEFLARHPDLAEQLEACLASLDFIHRAAVSGGAASGGASKQSTPTTHHAPLTVREVPPSVPVEPIVLGNYEIRREIGRGGMGIVYEALDRLQSRQVALKVLPFAAALDPRQLQRFEREAEAAALLSHAHIVPVFAVGAEGDVHYYAMKYIEGRTLGRMIADFRLQIADLQKEPAGGKSAICNLQSEICRQVAQLGIQAAEALEQAHQVGIIHRDIKPANLLVEPGGHLWVADFGLALFQHDAAGLTLTGDMVGTLRYMSPEQALGKHGIVDQRADIYSLGITLYELATLQPAFGASDRRELLHQIANAEPRPPRQLNKALPRDLETILLKATAKEAVGRYATARQMADDLHRLLAGEPIMARRPGLAERAGRWARRHKRLIAGACAAALVGALVLLVSSIFIVRARDDAEQRAKEARQAVDEMYTQVAQRWWFQQPYMEQVQRDFLLKALAFYEKFAQEQGNTPGLRLEAARALRRVADIHYRLGDQARAEEEYALAIARLEQLPGNVSIEPGRRDELAKAYDNHGNLLREQRKFAEAEKAYRRARELFAALAAEDADQPHYREGLAGTLTNLGIALYGLGQTGEAEKAYRESLDLLVALVKQHPAVPAYAHALASCRNNLGNLLRDSNRPREARNAYEQAAAGWRKLTTQMPGMPIFRQSEAVAHNGLGILYAGLGRNRDAEAEQRKALALRQRLADEYPGVPVYRQALAASRHNLARVLATEGQAEEARALFDQALALREDFAQKASASAADKQELADTYEAMAALHADTGKARDAERAGHAAIELRKQLAGDGSQETGWDLARSRHELAKILRGLGRREEAEALLAAALAYHEKTISASAAPAYRAELSALQSDLAALNQQMSRFEEAERLHRAALSTAAKLAAEFPKSPFYQLGAAKAQVRLGSLLGETGRPREAEAVYREAIALAEKLAAASPTSADYRRLLNFGRLELAELLIAVKRCPESEKLLAQAQPGLEKLAGEFPAFPIYREAMVRLQHAKQHLKTRKEGSRC